MYFTQPKLAHKPQRTFADTACIALKFEGLNGTLITPSENQINKNTDLNSSCDLRTQSNHVTNEVKMGYAADIA